MSATQPNLIHVEETSTAQLRATAAHIGASIHGQSFFTGTEAFKKAAELRDLIAELAKCEIPQANINLIGVTARSSSGLIAKSSSVEYHIEVKCLSMETLGPALAAICSQKNADVFVIDWQYSEYDKTKRDLLNQCVASAKSRADELSRTLGASLQAVHKLNYEFSDEEKRSTAITSQGAFGKPRARGSESLANLNLAHVSALFVTVKADFVVTEFAQ